jgi:hypothetical protein
LLRITGRAVTASACRGVRRGSSELYNLRGHPQTSGHRNDGQGRLWPIAPGLALSATKSSGTKPPSWRCRGGAADCFVIDTTIGGREKPLPAQPGHGVIASRRTAST